MNFDIYDIDDIDLFLLIDFICDSLEYMQNNEIFLKDLFLNSLDKE